MYFQHNKEVEITRQNYTELVIQKRLLLNNISKLFNDLKIKYVISHGNLIEYERNRLIYHDDDLDIRIDINDKNKLFEYGKKIKKSFNKYMNKEEYIDYEYNLIYDARIHNYKEQYIKDYNVLFMVNINLLKCIVI